MPATVDSGWPRLCARASYPGVLTIAFGLFAVLAGAGLDIVIASYVAGLLGAALVTLHELKFPYRGQWRPATSDVRADLSFMLLVQVALPYLLSISLVIFLAGRLRAAGLTADGLWPHELPVAVQAVLMLLAADFFRYWLSDGLRRGLSEGIRHW